MKKALSIILSALLAVSALTVTAFADEANIDYLEAEQGNTEFLDDPGDGFDASEDQQAALEAAAASIGKTALPGIYTFVGGTDGFSGEGPENLWDNSVTTKYCTGTFPTISAAQLDGKYKIDGIIMATANDNAEYNDRAPFEWYIYASADGQNWECIASGEDTFFEEVNYTYFAAPVTADGEYEFVMMQSEGALAGVFQVSELVICGEKVGESTVVVDTPDIVPPAKYIEGIESGDPIANNGASYDEAEAAASALGKTIITGVTALEGSSGNDNEGFENIWDNDVTTKWCSSTMPAISKAELDDTYGIDGIILATANDNSSNLGRIPSDWQIIGSNDGENWSLIVNGTDAFMKEADGSELDYTYYAASFDQTAGYKYVALQFTSAEAGLFQVSEVVLTGAKAEAAAAEVVEEPGFATADEAVASIGKTAISGYEYVDGSGSFDNETPANLFDGDTATKFCTNEFPASAIAKLGGTYSIDGIILATANDNAEYNGRLPSEWKISGSTDGENWFEIASGTADDLAEANFRYFAKAIDASEATSYVKFETEGTEANLFQLSELVLTGSEAEAPEAAEEPGFATADEAVKSIGKSAISGYEFVEGSNGFDNEGPANLFDGDTATKFCTNEFPASAIAKLDGTYSIDGIILATANDNAEWNGRLPTEWKISGSTDGENWFEIASGTADDLAEANFRYFAKAIDASEATSYVKFETEGTEANLFQLSELVLTGSAAEEVVVEPAETADETTDTAANTFDLGLVAAVAAVVSLAGFAVLASQFPRSTKFSSLRILVL